MTDIATRLTGVRARIKSAALAAGRDPEHITLLAVSKAQPLPALVDAAAAGQRAFGENYLDEALTKMSAVRGAEWHFIGQVQSNKTLGIAAHFDWVHTVDRIRIAERLAAQRPDDAPPLQVCLQVNISHEAGKGGVALDGLENLAEQVASLSRLRLRGLMAIPSMTDDVEAQRAAFATLRRLQDRLVAGGHTLDTLSMGMSADLEAAILEGATIVRVGTAVFGER